MLRFISRPLFDYVNCLCCCYDVLMCCCYDVGIKSLKERKGETSA